MVDPARFSFPSIALIKYEPDEAFRMIAEAGFKNMGMEYWLARTYAVYAELYRNEGDFSDSKEHLTKAIDIMKELKAYGWVKKFEKEMAALS